MYSVQPSEACGLQHSPSSVYDDLAAAQKQGQAQIGSSQTYCIRAVNPIGCNSGSYKSDPACVSVTIAWESAIFGAVVGGLNTGSAPIKDVTIQWYFADNPDFNGFGVTNADGKIVELSTGELGLNIQASY